MASKHEHLIEEIGKMSVMDLSQFVKDLQERFGVTAMAAVAAPAAGAAARVRKNRAARPQAGRWWQ